MHTCGICLLAERGGQRLDRCYETSHPRKRLARHGESGHARIPDSALQGPGTDQPLAHERTALAQHLSDSDVEEADPSTCPPNYEKTIGRYSVCAKPWPPKFEEEPVALGRVGFAEGVCAADPLIET